MAERWDAIIVGLGPAGAAAAFHLARSGARVLVLAGRAGRAKPCGGCLSRRAADLLDFLEPPRWLRARPVSTLELAAASRPTGRFQTGLPGAFFVERRRLDEFLASRAAEAGATVLAETARGVELEKGGARVRGRVGPWRSDWLLGADGAQGLTGRALGLGRTSYVYTALVEERPLPGALAERLEGAALLDLGAAPGGYAWAFGRHGVLNLGLAGRGQHLASTQGLLGLYQAFLARQGLGRPGHWRGALIPCPDRRRPLLFRGRAAVAGDAAATADPFLGEGIGQAVQSGLCAARAILAGDLGRYQVEMAATLYREHAHARALAGLVHRLPGAFQGLARRRPGSIELVWAVLRGQMTYGGIWAGVARGLLGR